MSADPSPRPYSLTAGLNRGARGNGGAPAVSVVIVNYNGARLLGDCLASLQAQTFRDFEIIFVDNGSCDDSVARARALMPAIEIVALGKNAGFAGGNNAGFAAARGKLIVPINNDTQCAEEFLAQLVRAADAHPKAGMFAPKILNFYERGVIDSVGGLLLGADGIGMGRGRGERDAGQYDALAEVLMPSGCAALYRREMLAETGAFAADFFAYCEDADLGLRCVWAGWGAVSVPRAVIYHKYSASSSSFSAFKLMLVERNHYFLALKNFTFGMLLALPFWTLGRYAVMGWVLLSGKGKGRAAAGVGSEKVTALLGAFLRGHWQALCGMPRQWRGRTKLKRIGGLEFRALLKRNRVSLRKIFSSE